MRCRRLPRSDIVVSEVGLGSCNFGEQVNQEDAHAQLDLAVDQYGVNFIVSSMKYVKYNVKSVCRKLLKSTQCLTINQPLGLRTR